MIAFARALLALAALRALDAVYPRRRPVKVTTRIVIDGRVLADSIASRIRDL